MDKYSLQGAVQMSLFEEELTSSSAELLANHGVAQENEKDSKEQADLRNRLSTYLEQCIPAGFAGKMFQVAFQPETSSQESSTSTFFFQRLRNAGILCAGELSTANLPEWTASLVPYLKDEGVCSLSDILDQLSTLMHKFNKVLSGPFAA